MVSLAGQRILVASEAVYPEAVVQTCIVGLLKKPPCRAKRYFQADHGSPLCLGIKNAEQDDLFVAGSLQDLIPKDHILRRR